MVTIGIFDRIGKLIKAQKNDNQPVEKEITLFDLKVGQVIAMDLEDWVIEGKVIYRQQPEVVQYWVKSGRQRQAVLFDHAAPDQAVILTSFAGRLNEGNEVKTEYILDDQHYFLDFQGECAVDVSGVAPVGVGELMYWQYETDRREIYRIEWQNSRFLHYDGRWINSYEIEVVA